MANLDNVKIGSSDSERIMFNTYYSPKANKTLIFGSIVPKDNTKIWNSIYGEWQVNDDWEIEILSPKTIAIKKFRIDTWGIRKIWNQGGANDTDSFIGSKSWNNFPIRVKGLDYVHNHVVYKEDANGNKTYGFGKAFCGNGGYNVYWYPGQFTTGSSIQGLGVQSCIGYVANQNEVDDSFCMGKHPWDIGTVVNITDGDITGKGSDGSYRATCIGLWGGYQTATSWHEYKQEGYTGNAYKVWDISDTPIIIDLDVPDTTTPTDVTSVECWDIYAGSEQVYHKDKTRENCWKPYGIMFPENFAYFPANLTLSDKVYCKWVASNRFVIKKIPANGINLTKLTTISWGPESYQANYIGFGVIIYNKPNSITAKFERTFTNVKENGDVSYTLNNGNNSIPSFSKKFYINNRQANAVFTEFKMSFTSNSEVDCNILVELVPIFNNNDYVSVNVNSWSILSKLVLPEVTDKISNMTKTLWNSKPTNVEFWDSVKEWFENNYTEPAMIQHGLFRNSNIDEIKLRLNAAWEDGTVEQYLWSNGPFKNSSIKKITIESVNGCAFSVGNSLFSGAGSLETVEIVLHKDTNYMVSATDFSGMFERCGKLKTFPANLIKYNIKRSHAFDQGIPCSLANYFFDYTGIETIPMYGTDRFADANTLVMHSSAAQTFNIGSTLKYLGPVIDMILVRPSGGYSIFRCENLTDARIKNLNHGSWNFDGENRGTYHGSLASLDAESVAYLFNNLMDLKTCNPDVHENKVDKAFLSWSTAYSSSWDTEFWTSRVAVRYFETRDRRGTGIVSTNQTLTDMEIRVSGLQDGDILSFGETEITTNGTHKVTKSNTNWEAFKLTGDTNDTTNVVKVIIENGLDYTNPLVNTANLYCPATWEDKITSDMISAANAKGWNIYIGGTLVEIN